MSFKVNAAARLVQAAKADVIMAMAYIKALGAKKAKLSHNVSGNIAFIIDKQGADAIAKNLTKQYGKPRELGDRCIWDIGQGRSILVFDDGSEQLVALGDEPAKAID